MSQGPNRNEINPSLGHLTDSGQGYPARGLKNGTSPVHSHGLTHDITAHIVEQDDLNATVKALLDLIQCIGLNFNFHGVRSASSQEIDGSTDGADCRQVVVLDHHPITQTKAVIMAAANPNGVFFEEAQTRCRFAGIDDFDRQGANLVDKLSGEGGDATEPLDKV